MSDLKLPPLPPIPKKVNNSHARNVSPIIEANRSVDPDFPLPRRKRVSVKGEVPLANKPGLEVGRAELARIIGVSVTTIGDWHNMGLPSKPKPKGKGWLYDVGQVMKWRVQHEHDLVKASMIDEQPKFEAEMSMIEAERRDKAAKAQLSELKLAIERKMVANIKDLCANFASAAIEIRAALIGLENKLPGRLAHKDVRFIEKAVSKEIRNLLEKLSEYNHEYISDPRGGERTEDRPADFDDEDHES